jgi:hypothetical protein
MASDNPKTTALKRDLDMQIARENIAWWENLRQEHLRKGQTIAAGKCEEEIGLWQQEINDA